LSERSETKRRDETSRAELDAGDTRFVSSLRSSLNDREHSTPTGR
jgi:hypothetical protein